MNYNKRTNFKIYVKLNYKSCVLNRHRDIPISKKVSTFFTYGFYVLKVITGIKKRETIIILFKEVPTISIFFTRNELESKILK